MFAVLIILFGDDHQIQPPRKEELMTLMFCFHTEKIVAEGDLG
jgi:hypothetical protein